MTTGRRNNPFALRRAPAGRAGGFTLLELIVVLVVVSTVLAIVSPSLRGFFVSRQTSDAAMKLVSLTQWARSEAVARGHLCRLNLDPVGTACWLTVQRSGAFVPPDGDAGQVFSLPDGASIVLQSPCADPAMPYIEFHPSGRTDVATIEIRGREGEVFLVACDSPTEPFHVIAPSEGSR